MFFYEFRFKSGCEIMCVSLSSDPSLNHPRRRHSSGNISTTLEMLPGLEGFQLETYGRVDKQTTTHARSDTHTHTHR